MAEHETPYRYIPFLSPAYRILRGSYRRMAYKGNAVYCALCNGRWREWLASMECPGCGSAPRHRLMWPLIQENIFYGKRLHVLHFAAEPCIRTWCYLMLGGNYVTCDLSAPGMDVHADIRNLPFKDHEFEMVICSHVLEHIEEDMLALSEITRVLSSGGKALIMVPYLKDKPTFEDPLVIDPKERERLFGQRDHVRIYGNDFGDRLRKFFRVTELRPAQNMQTWQLAELGLWDDVIFVCEKL